MSLIEEIKKPEGIEAQTYGRIGKKLERWRLALKMRRFEKKHKVETIPIGASKDNNFQESETNSEKRAKGAKSAMKAPKEAGTGLADFRGQKTQKQRKQEWEEGI